MKFLKFADFIAEKKIPKYSDVEEKLVDRSEVISDSSLVIFISYVWYQNYATEEEWSLPDDPNNSIYSLIYLAIQTIIDSMTSVLIMDHYLWIDYACLDVADKRKENNLDEIMEVCDCVVTPLMNVSEEFFSQRSFFALTPSSVNKSWIGEHGSYLNRSWCRLELFYTIAVPLHNEKTKNENFKDILRDFSNRLKRPHFLFGKDENMVEHLLLLPPISPALLSEYHPEQGFHSLKTDALVLQQHTTLLKDYINQLVTGYQGDLQKGLKHGFGKVVYADGSTYEGQWQLDHYHGKGKLKLKTGDIYEGDFADSQFHGFGKLVYGNGNIYEGHFEKNVFHGKGKFTFKNGDCYNGEYREGKRNGLGKFTFHDGSYYDGEFENDLKHGHGIYYYSPTSHYEGEFRDDRRHGIGKYFYANGDFYEGSFINGHMQGRGRYHSKNGDIYDGEYKDNHKHGEGKITYANGMTVDVSFANGQLNQENQDKSHLQPPETKVVEQKSIPVFTSETKAPSQVKNPPPPKSSFCIIS